MSMTTRPSLSRRAVSEAIGTALLVATVIGSGVMGERLSGGNVAIALLANSIATGDSAYHLYVLFDPDWEPTVPAQKALVSIGSVGVGELLALRK